MSWKNENARPKLLFLAHRLPYPPHKGEKLRAYNIIRGLAEEYDIYLGTMIDDPADWEHREALNDLCAVTHIADGRSKTRAKAAMTAMMRDEAVTISYFRHNSLADWVEEVTATIAFDAALLYSSGVAPYLPSIKTPPSKLIVDFVDADSEKWAALAKDPNPGKKMIYGREAQKVRKIEKALYARADASVLVTEAERELFASIVGSDVNTCAIGNGVDTQYWSEAKSFPSPYETNDKPRVIFTGAMDYEPNVAAVQLFAEHAMPKLKELGTPVDFIIAGSNPAPAVQALAKDDAVTVTGRVEDMRPWLGHADFSVAPLLIARGVQNKVLEAMAAGVPAVVTQPALTGINAKSGESVILANPDTVEGPMSEAARCGAACANVIHAALAEKEKTATIARNARAFVEAEYSWEARVAEFSALIQPQEQLRRAS